MTFADRYVNRDEARRRFGAIADAYGRSQLRGDPLADEAVASLRSARGQQLLDRALARGIGSVADAPPALSALFAQLDTLPEWVDVARLERGARTYRRVGPATMFVLSAWSLMNGYHCGPAVKPLAFTRQLEAMAPRRLVETGRFITEVIQPGGMTRFARGFEISVRVRLVHAHVRAALARSPAWRAQAWGVPINQGDMLGTIIEFSLLWIRGAELMGFHFDEDEREDVLHLWRYVGWVSGVDDELLSWLSSIEVGARAAEMIRLVQPGPDADSLALAAALRDVPRRLARTPLERLTAPLVVRYHDGLTWAFNGDTIARELEIPNALWRHSIVPTRAIVRSLEHVRRRIPGATWLATRLAHRELCARIAYLLERREPAFTPPERIDETRGGRTAVPA